MPASTLDPKAALLLIDLQKGIVNRAGPHPFAEVISRASALAGAFRHHRRPVVLVNVAGSAPGRTEHIRSSGGPRPPDWTDFVPELNRQPQDHVVTKRTWGAFIMSDLESHLNRLGVTQVVLAGVATSIGVESTARQAYELGFNVTLAIDAMLDPSPEAHQNSIRRIFPRLGETATTDAIIGLMEKWQ